MTGTGTCARCGADLPGRAERRGRPARWCSRACQQAAYRARRQATHPASPTPAPDVTLVASTAAARTAHGLSDAADALAGLIDTGPTDQAEATRLLDAIEHGQTVLRHLTTTPPARDGNSDENRESAEPTPAEPDMPEQTPQPEPPEEPAPSAALAAPRLHTAPAIGPGWATSRDGSHTVLWEGDTRVGTVARHWARRSTWTAHLNGGVAVTLTASTHGTYRSRSAALLALADEHTHRRAEQRKSAP